MKAKRLSGDELFEFHQTSQGQAVKDFWAWALSRLIMDGPRGDLAEYIVRMALGEDLETPKRGWGECDIKDCDGFRIEVKCSSLLQEWERDTPSTPTFSIAETMSCDIEEIGGIYHYVGRQDEEIERRSDAYVFCLFACDNREIANPLNLDQWEFWVVPTDLLNQKLGKRKSVTPATLKKLGIEMIKYDKLAEAVGAVKAGERNS